MKYKGYEIFRVKSLLGKETWSVGTRQPNGQLVVHASGYPNSLTAKRAADAHFGRLQGDLVVS